jgi:hypothetical protein
MSRSRKKHPVVKGGGYMKRRDYWGKVRRNWKMTTKKYELRYNSSFDNQLEYEHPYNLTNQWDVIDYRSYVYIDPEFKKDFDYIPDHWYYRSIRFKIDHESMKKWYRK